jgi:SAM-dependent methyltransferase
MMTRESLNLFYLDDYREMYSGKKKADIRFFSTQYRDGKAIIDFIKNYDPSISFQDKLILEIGCGAGGILAAFRDAGAQVMGFDLGSDYLDYGIKDGLRLERGTIEDYQETRKPDIIIYSHVLEHVSSPSEELEHVKKICHDKTLVYIGVPGLLSVQTTYVDFLRYLHIAHLHHFSLGTLKNLLSKHGFTLVFGNEDIRSLFIYNPSCVKSRTINCYHENMNYLMETENKRHINRFKKRVRKWITKLSYYFVNG